MITDTQIDIWIPKMAQYQLDYTEEEERRAEAEGRLEQQFKDMIADLVEWEVEDGDQERMLARYKAAGYQMSLRLRKDIYRAFDAAGALQNGKTTTARKEAIRRVTRGEKGYGKRTLDDIKETNDRMNEGRMRAALWTLLQKIQKRFWWPLGQMVRMNPDVLTWDIVLANLTKYIEAWHITYDAELAANKAKDAKRAANK